MDIFFSQSKISHSRYINCVHNAPFIFNLDINVNKIIKLKKFSENLIIGEKINDTIKSNFHVSGPMAWLMPLSVAISTFGSANGTIFAAGRLCYVASREGHLVDVLSFVHIKKLTPAPALLFHAVVALAMVLSGDIEGLIDFFRSVQRFCLSGNRFSNEKFSKMATLQM